MKFYLVVLFLVISANNGICRHDTRKRTDIEPTTKTFKYYTNHDHGITIPIMIHLDKFLTRNISKEYKYREKARKLFRDLLKNVETFFQRPNFVQNIKFVLIDVKVLKNVTKKFVMDENVSKYLNSYCQWQGEKKAEQKQWYFSVLFTGLDLFYFGRNDVKVRSSTGRGYMSGVCSLTHSCTILEWRRNNIAMKLAHEIGHSLGISHDGAPHKECKGDRYIMAPKNNRHHPAKTWSPCSKRDFQTFISSKYSWCLRSGSKNLV